MGSQGNPRGNVTNLKPQQPGEPSHNPSGISKEKTQLRRLAEGFFNENGITKYLERLDELAMQKKSPRTALMAIKEILLLTLGKNFSVVSDNSNDDIANLIFNFESTGPPDMLEILEDVDIPEEYKDKIRDAVNK
ncbi:hypothetical protein JXM67_04500 [candidate division WOR-3 bacterium]|nr:hypothetical protein [candidate division WOR-3 bacterium]